MGKTILITGGAGFIGSHCAALLLEHGHTVKALDSLDPQIHGKERRPPPYLDRRVELKGVPAAEWFQGLKGQAVIARDWPTICRTLFEKAGGTGRLLAVAGIRLS